MIKIKNYILDSIREVQNKVSWPGLAKLQSNAVLVLIASLIFAIVIGFMDFGFKNALEFFYEEF